MDLKGRVAIVTGGGTGIGRAVCLRLAKAGAKAVVVNYSRSDKDARATAAELIVLGPDAMAHKADVSNESEVKAMMAAVIDRYGRLDVLINNAGTTRFIAHADLEALTDEVWDEIFKVNLKGTFYCCRAAAPELRKTGGTIVNIASVTGHLATGSSIAWSPTSRTAWSARDSPCGPTSASVRAPGSHWRSATRACPTSCWSRS